MSKRKETKSLAVALGAVLREIRGGDARFAGGDALTQSDVAAALGFHQNYISTVERGINTLPLHRILEVCKAYQCTPDELLRRFAKQCGKKAK